MNDRSPDTVSDQRLYTDFKGNIDRHGQCPTALADGTVLGTNPICHTLQ